MTRFCFNIILLFFSTSALAQFDQFAHIELTNNNSNRELGIVGSSTLDTMQSSFLSRACIQTDSSTDDWIILQQAAPTDLYVLEFQIEDRDSLDIRLALGEDGADPSAGFRIVNHQAQLLFNSEQLFSFDHNEDRIYKVTQCAGKISYFVDNILIVSETSDFVDSVRAVVSSYYATGDSLFLHYRIDVSCEKSEDITYFVPKRKSSSQSISFSGNEFGIYYIEKYAISSTDIFYKNDKVNIVVKEAKTPFNTILNIQLNNVYGVNKHIIDATTLSTNTAYVSTISGVNKNQTYYLPIIKTP